MYSPKVYHYFEKPKPWQFRLSDDGLTKLKAALPPLSEASSNPFCPFYAYEDLKWFYGEYWKYMKKTPIFKRYLQKADESGSVYLGDYLRMWLWHYNQAKA